MWRKGQGHPALTQPHWKLIIEKRHLWFPLLSSELSVCWCSFMIVFMQRKLRTQTSYVTAMLLSGWRQMWLVHGQARPEPKVFTSQHWVCQRRANVSSPYVERPCCHLGKMCLGPSDVPRKGKERGLWGLMDSLRKYFLEKGPFHLEFKIYEIQEELECNMGTA